MTATVPELLTVAEAAERLGLSRKTAYRWIREGTIPALRLGGPGAPLRVDASELVRWLYSPDEEIRDAADR